MRHGTKLSSTITAALIACVALTHSARAQVTYSYTGNPYNVFEANNPAYTYTPTQNLSFIFTLAAAMPANSSVDLFLQTLTWRASDGKYVFGGVGQVGLFESDAYTPGQTVSVLSAAFHTNAAGVPDQWSISLFDGAHSSQAYMTFPGVQNLLFTVNGTLTQEALSDYVYSRPTSSGEGDLEKAGVGTAGAWTVTLQSTTATPEPSTLMLLATGLAGVGGAGWRRRLRNRGAV